MPSFATISNNSKGAPVATPKQVPPVTELVKPDLSEKDFLKLPFQRKLSVGSSDDPLEKEADSIADQVMRIPHPGFIKSNCNHFNKEEKVQRKLQGKFIPKKFSSHSSVIDVVSNQIHSKKGAGKTIHETAKSFMESRFGRDFSNVKIHIDDESIKMNRMLNAKAFTVGNDIFFNEGQYNPNSDSGKHLLAHELTHTLQQKAIENPPGIDRSKGDNHPFSFNTTANIIYTDSSKVIIQRKNIDSPLIILEPGKSVEENVAFLNYTTTTRITRLGLITPGMLRVFAANGTKGNKLLKTYKIKNTITPPPFLYILETGGFYIYGYDNVHEKEVFVGKGNTNSSPQLEKIIDGWGANLTVNSWFLNEGDLNDFIKNHQDGQFFGLWVSDGSGKSGSGTGKGDKAPSRPVWMKSYLAEMNKLIKTTKESESNAKDLPDIFSFYYSKEYQRFRASARKKEENKKQIQVYLDVEEKSPYETTLDITRTKIRIKRLEDFKDPFKGDVSPETHLKDEKLWAMELLLGLRKKIKEERHGRTDNYEIPDAINLSYIKEIPDELFLSVSVNILRMSVEGIESTETKTARLADALRKSMTVEGVMPVLKSVTLAMREDRRKRELDPKKERAAYNKTLSAYPAEIIPLDTRNDFIGVKAGVGNYTMKLAYEKYEGHETVNNVVANMQTIFYRWYAFSAADFLDAAELQKLATIKDWKDRRPLLVRLLKYKTLRQDSLYKMTGGWDRDPDGEVNLPDKEGDIVVFGQAFVQPKNDIYRIPSEALFPVHLVDGYTLARDGVNAPANLLKNKKDILASEKAKGVNASIYLIDNLEAEITALEQVKGRSIIENLQNSYDDSAKGLRYAQKIKRILEDHPIEFANYILSETDEKIKIGDELYKLFIRIIEEDTRPVATIDKINWFIIKIKEQTQSLKDILIRGEKFKGEIKGNVYSPLTTFVSNKTATQYNLLMMLAESSAFGDYHHSVTTGGGRADNKETNLVEYPHRTVMILIDITSESTQRRYKGISDNPDKYTGKIEATKNAYKEFSNKAIYGDGYVNYKVPGLIDSAEGINIFSSLGSWEKAKKYLATIAAVAGVVALVVGTVASGGLLGAAAVAIGLGAGAVGAGLAIGNITDRVENHTFKYDVSFAMDLLNIVGFFASATKLLGATRFSRAAEGAADAAALEKVTVAAIRFEEGFLLYQRVETVTNIVLTSYQTAKDLEAIDQTEGLTEKQKAVMRNALLRNALMSGAMIAFSIKDSMKSKATLIDETSKLLKMNYDRRKYIELNKELGLMDEHGTWLIPEIKKALETQAARINEAEATDAKNSESAMRPNSQTDTPETKPVLEDGGAGLPPVNTPKQGGGGGSGKPRKAKLNPEAQNMVEEIDARIADLMIRQEAGDIGAGFYVDILQQAKKSIRENPGSETITNARETLSDMAVSYPTGDIVVGLQEYFKDRRHKISAGDSTVILEFLGQAKTWTNAISFLQGKGKSSKQALEAVGSFRESIQRRLKSAFQADELKNASNKPESDKDLNFPGNNAGKNLIEAEAKMRLEYGDDWDVKLRMNFYTEGDRLNMFEREAGNLSPSTRTRIEANLAKFSDQLALAKMLRHTSGDDASTKRVDKLIEISFPNEVGPIKELAKIPKNDVLARRDALHLEVDSLKQKYDNPETHEEARPMIAAKITKKQIEINFLSEEAYISPSALKIITDPDVILTPQESVSALLSNLEMMEHTIQQAGGDIVVAARQYPLYKYMHRGSRSMQHAQQDLFFDYLNRTISDVDRNGAENFTPGQLQQHYDSYMDFSYKFIETHSLAFDVISLSKPTQLPLFKQASPQAQINLPMRFPGPQKLKTIKTPTSRSKNPKVPFSEAGNLKKTAVSKPIAKGGTVTETPSLIKASISSDETIDSAGRIVIKSEGRVGTAPDKRPGLEKKYPAGRLVGLPDHVRFHVEGIKSIGDELNVVYAPSRFNISETALIENHIRIWQSEVESTGGELYFEFTATCHLQGEYEGIQIKILESITWKLERRIPGTDIFEPIFEHTGKP